MKCEKCHGTGYIETIIDGNEYVKECECLKSEREQQRQEKYLTESGLKGIIGQMSLESYKTDCTACKSLKKIACDYLKEPKAWWYINGVSGCGKTHITTAICGELIKKGTPVHYMQWRDESTELKALIGNAEKYGERIRRLKKVKVLYIDDFLKGSVTEADIKLAFEIINARYVSGLKTLFSSERDIREVLAIDEAVGGRIKQKADRYLLEVTQIGNRRLI